MVKKTTTFWFSKAYSLPNAYHVYRGADYGMTSCGIVFRWGKYWCTTRSEFGRYSKTRREAAAELSRIIDEGK